MGEEGSVGWMFKSRGVITVPKDKIGEDALFEFVTEHGAEDFDPTGDEYEIRVEPDRYHALVDALTKKGLEPSSSELVKVADNMIKVAGADAGRAMALLEMLDDLDDVQNVHTNAEFDPDEIENL
jgi:transcriptional/translational regulatory protein YebC/TACO1